MKSSRRSLKERLRASRPSRDPGFARGIGEIRGAARKGDAGAVRAVLMANHRLQQGREFMGNTAILDPNPASLDAFADHGFTALALAAHFGRIQTLRRLIERGADVNVMSRHSIDATPLIAAQLVGRGVDRRARDVEGVSPVDLARRLGDEEVVRVLPEGEVSG